MVALLEGTLERDPSTFHTADSWRDAIMHFVIDYWAKLQSQVTCPAKSQDPRACYGCVDQQVYSCLEKNGPTRHYIEQRRKRSP